jgi:ribosomal subunit interface protein
MQFDIHAPKIGTTESLSDHIERRMHAALGQFEHRISTVDVKIQDLTAGRGGVDKSCSVFVHLKRAGVVMAQEVQSDMYAAVSLAADKIKHAVGHKLDRRRLH